MKNIDENLDRFSKVVLEKAFAVRKELEESLKIRKKAVIESKEIMYLENAYKKIQQNKARIISETNEIISKKQLDYKKRLIVRRGEIVSEIFNEVIVKINDFIQSEEYYDWLLKKANTAVKSVFENKGVVVVMLNKSDEKHIERLKNDLRMQFRFGVIEINAVQGEDIIGGVIVFNKSRNVLLDYSIKQSLENAKQDFLKKSGLTIE